MTNAPTEEACWREHHRNGPYVQACEPYNLYAPAYRTEFNGRAYEVFDPKLQARYQQTHIGLLQKNQ